jgi:hypothetical protein
VQKFACQPIREEASASRKMTESIIQDVFQGQEDMSDLDNVAGAACRKVLGQLWEETPLSQFDSMPICVKMVSASFMNFQLQQIYIYKAGGGGSGGSLI